MPPKGWTSGRPEGFVKAVRLTEETIERVTRHIDRLQRQLSFVRVNEGMAIRNLIEEGLSTVEAREFNHGVMVAEGIVPSSPASETSPLVPHESLTPEPQTPPAPDTPTIVPEPEPELRPSPLQPAQPTMVPTGMKQCRHGHAPYPMSKSECPDCVRNRRRRYRESQAAPLPEGE